MGWSGKNPQGWIFLAQMLEKLRLWLIDRAGGLQ
jgi:hypothetical protein